MIQSLCWSRRPRAVFVGDAISSPVEARAGDAAADHTANLPRPACGLGPGALPRSARGPTLPHRIMTPTFHSMKQITLSGNVTRQGAGGGSVRSGRLRLDSVKGNELGLAHIR